MNAKEFVACWKQEKNTLVKDYLDTVGEPNIPSELDVANSIASLNLTTGQMMVMRRILEGTLRDGFYTLLLGLDGAASIGGIQQVYRIYDEKGNLISDCGDIEAEAWGQFHGEAAEL